uniref:Mobilization protein n=1 Tax=Meloidogyne hapla TaxID=6305 RepID=A0A1I8B0Y3_MELHA
MWIETFFEQYPHNYWDAIRDLEQELENHKVFVETKPKAYQNETILERKEDLKSELDHLTSLYIELEQKIKDSKELDENAQARANQEIQRFKNSIKRMRKNLEALESAVIEKDLNKTREEFHQQNSQTHSEYVKQFFKNHPTDHWNVLSKNFSELKELHVRVRNKRDAHLQEKDEGKRIKLGEEFNSMNKLAEYRRNRFKAIQQEAMKRAMSFDIPIPPTNDEIKEMQKN